VIELSLNIIIVIFTDINEFVLLLHFVILSVTFHSEIDYFPNYGASWFKDRHRSRRVPYVKQNLHVFIYNPMIGWVDCSH